MKIYRKIDKYGNIFWCKKGTTILHREDGPAVEYYYGNKYWYQHGKLHRLDGPAIESTNGYKRYCFNGKDYTDIKTDEEWLIFQIVN